MLVPNSEYIIVQIDDAKSLVPGKTFVGKVYAVGQPNFAPQPVGGDGRNFSFARQPESFPITKGDQVIVGSFLDTIEENKIPACDVEGLVLAIFSDMQIDEGDDNWKSMYAGIEQMYHDAGMRLWGVPFHPPHILFWCLRLGNGFPTLSTQKNASMMSGFSPALLDLFCEKGIDALAQSDSWQILDELLSDERYAPLLIRFSEEMV